MYSNYSDDDEKRINWLNLFIKVAIIVILAIMFVWFISLIGRNGNGKKKLDENIILMKEAGKKYFTEEKLPELSGTSEKITLNELYNEKLINTLKDKKGKLCDDNKSYIILTKYNDNYNMKIYLKCSKEEKTTTITMKKYSYCEYTICEKDSNKKDEIISKPSSSSSSSSKPSSATNIEYKYIKPGYYTEWSNFSAWTTNKVEASNTVKVETKVQTTTKEIPTTIKEMQKANLICPTGYSKESGKCVKYTTYYENPICSGDYINRDGFTCTYNGPSEKVETYVSTTKDSYKLPDNTNDYRYEYVSSRYVCTNGTCRFLYTYKTYKITYKSTTYTKEATCPSGYSKSGSKCSKSVANYQNSFCPDGYSMSDDKTYCYKYVDKQGSSLEKVNVTYYRYATRKYIEESIKYSKSNNDQELLKQGYKLA